jgi:hypothetical protein
MTRILDMSSVGSSLTWEKKKARRETVHVVLGACVYLDTIRRSQQRTDRYRVRLARSLAFPCVTQKVCARKDSVL